MLRLATVLATLFFASVMGGCRDRSPDDDELRLAQRGAEVPAGVRAAPIQRDTNAGDADLPSASVATPSETSPSSSAAAAPSEVASAEPAASSETEVASTAAPVAPVESAPDPSAPKGVLRGLGSLPEAPDAVATRYSEPSVVGRVMPRGASTVFGEVLISSAGRVQNLALDIQGALPGVYDVHLASEPRCPPTPVPSEIATGQATVTSAVRARPTPGQAIGSVTVSSDGHGHFETVLASQDLPESSSSATVILTERPGSVNPSLADASGVVACGQIVLRDAAS